MEQENKWEPWDCPLMFEELRIFYENNDDVYVMAKRMIVIVKKIRIY